jgi:hypothetical protein
MSTAFRKGLMQTGTIEGQNATVEYHWLAGQYDRLPALMADLVRRPPNNLEAPGPPSKGRAPRRSAAKPTAPLREPSAPKRARPKQRIANLVAEPSETVTLPVKGPSNTRCTRFPKAASLAPEAAL